MVTSIAQPPMSTAVESLSSPSKRSWDDVDYEDDQEHGGKRRRTSETDTATPAAPTELLPLLDFSLLTSLTDIESRFDHLAKALLQDFRLAVACEGVQTEFDILELEFYLHIPEYHEDPFTHASEEQAHSGRWYFHRAPRRSADSRRSLTSSTAYRGGSRKGLDLTIGGPVTSPYFASGPSGGSLLFRGGILLRTIRRVSDRKIISGPSLLVDEILRLSGAASIATLVEGKWRSNSTALRPASSVQAAANHASLYLVPAKTSSTETPAPPIYRSPRIGLDLSHPGTTKLPSHPRIIFISRPYRYFTSPHLLTSNGRTQTFLGIYQHCLHSQNSGDKDSPLIRELVRLTGLKETTALKYLADYRLGFTGGALDSFIGPAGKGASSSPSTYLKMMGTLERLRSGSG